MELSKQTHYKLLQLAQRQLKAGELFLLAKLLADKIPVIVDGQLPDSLLCHTLNFRPSVDTVIYTLNEYTHISSDKAKYVYQMVDSIWAWRHAVATGGTTMLFSGSNTTVVDDVSCILNYVSLASIAPVADIAEDANYMHMLLLDVVNTVWG